MNFPLKDRRTFLRNSIQVLGALALPGSGFCQWAPVPLFAHLWVYASKYPPRWDAAPVLDQAFADIKGAGFAGIELMAVNLEQDDAVGRIGKLVGKYELPVSGASFEANMWDRERHDAILQDVVLLTGRLRELGGRTFGLSVGDAGRKKTDAELEVQAATLNEILNICDKRNIIPNLHNHTYELRDGLYDLQETLRRVPELRLGPDINWLIRGGVDPVAFIDTYGSRIGYLHLRDQHANGRWTEALGEGATDFAAIARALRRVGFSGAAAVELAYDAEPSRTTAQNWQISRNYMRRVFQW
ncbi:Sugar phosphate isomerase/epimerase [Cnuella takakiae]|uniref:Sugar phosphate isomerase/epimerase n=1 Tax=Cnuella takakiae TaxID=1302690 RepID=A0A1M4WWY9_9BACT|nr:sugar phosphate isomerase/epimerase [Cnuella takakiae]OLY91596.1 hypothetical protein BUE76_06540 [Cnuella takakiae]SHE85710.1 Sugar phosphate isomerase/epimerase [Cnuella takakiae]